MWSFSLYDRRLPRYRTFYNSSLTTMLNVKKEEKKMQKIQNLKFHNSLYNFGRGPLYEYAYIFGSKSSVHFQRRCRLKFFLPYGSMYRKIVCSKFGIIINSCLTGSEKMGFKDDGRPRDDSSSSCAVAQSRAKYIICVPVMENMK